jgi:ABC-type multidrug transport system fused ATPase/permease subunit
VSFRQTAAVSFTTSTSDPFLVLDKGQLAEQGSHSELIAKHGIYHHLFSQQFAGVAHAVT